MKKEMKIIIRGMHEEIEGDNNGEIIENIHTATYIQKDGSHYLFYEEMQEGFGLIKNKVAVDKALELRITKKGVVNSHMEFTLGESRICQYSTPFSTVEMNFLTEELDVQITDHKLYIKVSYAMDLEGQAYARSTVEIESV